MEKIERYLLCFHELNIKYLPIYVIMIMICNTYIHNVSIFREVKIKRSFTTFCPSWPEELNNYCSRFCFPPPWAQPVILWIFRIWLLQVTFRDFLREFCRSLTLKVYIQPSADGCYHVPFQEFWFFICFFPLYQLPISHSKFLMGITHDHIRALQSNYLSLS